MRVTPAEKNCSLGQEIQLVGEVFRDFEQFVTLFKRGAQVIIRVDERHTIRRKELRDLLLSRLGYGRPSRGGVDQVIRQEPVWLRRQRSRSSDLHRLFRVIKPSVSLSAGRANQV